MQAVAPPVVRSSTASRALFLRRLHSLSGVFPVAVFLVLHLVVQARGMAGEAAFERTAGAVRRLPLWAVVELFGIVLPLAFHASYGVKLALDRSRVTPGRYVRDGAYLAQRVSGLITLAFIAYHLSDFWVPKMLGRVEPQAFYGLLASRLSATVKGVPLLALLYLVGVSAAVFHMTNGLCAVARTLGFVTSQRGRRTLLAFVALLGGGIWLLGASTTIYFATGVRWTALAPGGSAPWCYVVDRSNQDQAVVPNPAASSRAAPADSRSPPKQLSE